MFLYGLLSVHCLELLAHPGDLILAREENEYTARRQSRMNLAGFLDRLCNVVGRRPPAEVYGHWVLTSRDVDDRWWGREQRRVLREVGDA